MENDTVDVMVLPGKTLYVGGSHFAFTAGETVRVSKAHADEMIARGVVKAANANIALEPKPAA